ncbi:MAG: hypothetical protein ACOY3K_02685 [Candidatus Omnitrophota bacterium]
MKKLLLSFLGLLSLCLVLGAGRGFAEPHDQALVTVLLASNQGTDFNLDNDEYKDKLIQLFSYTHYEQMDQIWVPLEKSKREKVLLPDGYELVLTLQNAEKDRLLVQAVIKKMNLSYVDTVLSIKKPGVVFLGGPKAGEQVLILALEYRG